jgi:predicted RNase H-like nuclease
MTSSIDPSASGSDGSIRFLGIDLAWTPTGRSGVCVLGADGTILDEDQLEATALVGWVRGWQGPRSVLAIDGPLVVPVGSAALRPVERELHRRYGRDHAGPFPGGGASTAMRGHDRSPAATLVDELGSYVVDPSDRLSAHRVIEVFPAPTWLELFGLPTRVRYKRGRLAERIVALAVLRGLLADLSEADPPLVAGSVDRITERRLAAKTAREWKAIEDILDARLCAYTAMLWGREPSASWVVTGNGSWEDGYVVVPTFGRRPSAIGRPKAPLSVAEALDGP